MNCSEDSFTNIRPTRGKQACCRDGWMSCSENPAPAPPAPKGPPPAERPPPPGLPPCTLKQLTVDPRGWPRNEPRTKKMNFPERFFATTVIHGATERVEDVEFLYHKSGQNRDTFVAKDRPWLLKGMALSKKTKKCTNQPIANQCYDEWQSYLGSKTLRPYLPVVFGYCEVMPENVPVACLLMERVAFTWDEFKEKMHRAPLREANLLNAVVAQCQIVAFFNEVAQARIPLCDAHGGNLCFVDDSFATVRLVDWCGNDRIAKETFYEIMKRSIKYFFQFSPGAHTHDRGAGSKELRRETPDVQENILRWREFLQQVSQWVNKWFRKISEPWNLGPEMQKVPVETLERLRHELRQLAMAATAKAPCRTSCSAASGGQTSSPATMNKAHGQICDDEASDKEEESDPAFRWGATAHRSLCQAAKQQLDWMRNNAIRHGRSTKFHQRVDRLGLLLRR